MTSILQTHSPIPSSTAGGGGGAPLNVNISSIDGITPEVNIDNLAVHLSHSDVVFDSIRIGDGTDLLGINADGTIGVGNATGVADFGFGSPTPQTLRATEASQSRSPLKATVVASGAVAAGAQSVTFITDTSFSGDILGDATPSGTVLTFSANANDVLTEIPYTVNAGSMQILTVT